MKILLVDAFNLFIRCFSTISQYNESGNHVGAISGSISSLYSFYKRVEPDFIFLCYEGKNSGNKRRKSFHLYKSGRRSPHTINNQDSLSPESEFWNELMLFQQLISMTPICPVSVDYLEGDDIISYLVRSLTATGNQCIIASTDQDYYQLISENTSIYNPTKKEIIDQNSLFEKFQIPSYNWLIAKCFFGDKSDNISKIKGIKAKKLVKLFPEISNTKFESIDSFVDFYIKKDDKKNLKYLTSESIELLKNNYHIMNLMDYDRILSIRNIDHIKHVIKNWKPEMDTLNFRLLMSKNSINLDLNFSTLTFMFRRLEYESQKFTEHIRKVWS